MKQIQVTLTYSVKGNTCIAEKVIQDQILFNSEKLFSQVFSCDDSENTRLELTERKVEIKE